MMNKQYHGAGPHTGIPEKRLQGLYGEDLALDWFLAQDYLLLKRNLRRPHLGEVDLVLHRQRTIHVVEVKSLGAACQSRTADPLDYVTQSQIRRMLRVLELWLGDGRTMALLPDWDDISVDLFTVDQRHRPPLLQHYTDILPPEFALPGF